MKISYFILIVTFLSFAIGLFVAAIIWVIKFGIITKENNDLFGIKELIHHFSSSANQNQNLFVKQSDQSNSQSNQELYLYYHGKSLLGQIFGNTVKANQIIEINNNLKNRELHNFYHGISNTRNGQSKSIGTKNRSENNDLLNKELYSFYHGKN